MTTGIRWLARFVAKALIVCLAFLLALLGPVSVRVVQAQGTGSISGTVRDSNGDPVGNARVGIYALGDIGVPFTTTISNGTYTISGVPHSAGPYDVQLLAPCSRDQVKRVVVDGAETVNFTIPAQDKSAGYRCAHTVFPQYIAGDRDAGLSGDDNEIGISFPFDFPFFGAVYTGARVNTNGFINFQSPAGLPRNLNRWLPDSDPNRPNAAIYAFWDDLVVDAAADVRFATGGTEPNRFVVIEWLNVTFFEDPRRVSFEIVLFEDGRIALQYKDIALTSNDLRERGNSATVGIENQDGTAAFQRLYNQPYLDNGFGIEFAPAPK